MQLCRQTLTVLVVTSALCACATGPQVKTVQKLSDSADAPYENLLVIFLFSKFDPRRYLESEIVNKLSELGINATASTSLMDSRTPVTREIFLNMVEDIDADAVMISQLVLLETKEKMVEMSPEATYNLRPTYYYNVFSVDLQEYVEPQAADFKYSVLLGTQLYSVRGQDAVWAIESMTRIHPELGERASYSIYVDEADAITKNMMMDGLIGK